MFCNNMEIGKLDVHVRCGSSVISYLIRKNVCKQQLSRDRTSIFHLTYFRISRNVSNFLNVFFFSPHYNCSILSLSQTKLDRVLRFNTLLFNFFVCMYCSMYRYMKFSPVLDSLIVNYVTSTRHCCITNSTLSFIILRNCIIGISKTRNYTFYFVLNVFIALFAPVCLATEVLCTDTKYNRMQI